MSHWGFVIHIVIISNADITVHKNVLSETVCMSIYVGSLVDNVIKVEMYFCWQLCFYFYFHLNELIL